VGSVCLFVWRLSPCEDGVHGEGQTAGFDSGACPEGQTHSGGTNGFSFRMTTGPN
jgi:hypothetical protein